MNKSTLKIAQVRQEISRLQMRDAILRHAIRHRLVDKLSAPASLAAAFGVGAVVAATLSPARDARRVHPRKDRLLAGLGWMAELSGVVVTLRTAYRALRS